MKASLVDIDRALLPDPIVCRSLSTGECFWLWRKLSTFASAQEVNTLIKQAPAYEVARCLAQDGKPLSVRREGDSAHLLECLVVCVSKSVTTNSVGRDLFAVCQAEEAVAQPDTSRLSTAFHGASPYHHACRLLTSGKCRGRHLA